MKNNNTETILRTNEVSPKRYLWYLLILGGFAIFGLYLLYSMSSYQSETNPCTMSELFFRALRSDGGLPFVALVIPASAVVAYFIARGWGKIEVVVTNQRVYGSLFLGSNFNLPLECITNVEKVSRTRIQITSTYGITTLHLLDNCNEIYTALTGKDAPAISRADGKKQERMNALQILTDDELTTRLGSMQAAARIAYVTVAILAIGCIIAGAIPFIKYGFEYGMSIAPAYLLLFLFFCLIIAYPIHYIRIRHKDAIDEISNRADSSQKMTRLHNLLREKRIRATKILVSIIVITPIICGAGAMLMGGGGSSSYDDGPVTCSSCHREFDRSSKNGKSIARRNMCELCYENMIIMDEALDEALND